ncbi:MAG: hypothetical protein R6U51_00015 [Anaerolineales bacterium]
MLKKVFLIVGAFLLASGLGVIMNSPTVLADGLYSLGSSGDVEKTFLEPIRPGDKGWNVEPDRFEDQGEAINGFVKGSSAESTYRCVVYLEPIKPGETASEASEPVCASGAINTIDGFSIDSSYLITKFYDRTNYRSLLIEYYGGSPCSPSIAYGVTDLPDNLDNKFASGKAYSDCDHISVYDFNDYSGPSYSCGANCSSFYALNDEVSSWTAGD